MNEEWRLVTSSRAYQDYVVVDSNALEGAARRSICAKCASSVHTIRSARSSSGLRIPDRPNLELHPIQGHDARECLAHALDLKEIRHIGQHSCGLGHVKGFLKA